MSTEQSEFRYRPVEGWPTLPDGYLLGDVNGIALNSKGEVFVFSRGTHSILVFSHEGEVLRTWGEGVFVRPHSIVIDKDDIIYCVDDRGHAVHKFSPDGDLLMTIETAANPADTGYVAGQLGSVRVAGPPFNTPTDIALSPSGELYVTDGYGNARVHKFSADGTWVLSWGEPGAGPGQFLLPHGLGVDADGLVYVADRENNRVQIFTPEGRYLREWNDLVRPSQVRFDEAGHVYVAEVGPAFKRDDPYPGDFAGGWFTVRDRQGKVLARLGEREPMWAPHGIAVSGDDVYVGSVTVSHGKGLFSSNRLARIRRNSGATGWS